MLCQLILVKSKHPSLCLCNQLVRRWNYDCHKLHFKERRRIRVMCPEPPQLLILPLLQPVCGLTSPVQQFDQVKLWLQPTYVQDWTTMLFGGGKRVLLNTMLVEIPTRYYTEIQACTSFKIKPKTNTGT